MHGVLDGNAIMVLKLVALITSFLVIVASTSASTIPESRVRDINRFNLSLANDTKPYAFIIIGVTGDLSRREIFPSLWYLYRNNLLPPKTSIHGYALNPMSKEELRERVKPFAVVKSHEEKLYDKFWTIVRDVVASQNQTFGYNKLCRILRNSSDGNRIFYLAVPPSASFASQIKRACRANKGWTRLVLEKPFGRDLNSSKILSQQLSKLFNEDQIYRIDHFLGYEMVQNILTLRFGNRLFSDWSRDNVAAIEVDFKENFGIEGRGAFFDKNGIIREVMQNHLLQILSLIAMEKPKSLNADDIRNEKVRLLRSTRNIVLRDVVLGQYVGNPNSKDPREHLGYVEEPTVPKNSNQSTFAMTVLKINNERWAGVPFIIRAGKGLNINQTEVIIVFKNVDNDLFRNNSKRNKLVIRIGKTKSLLANISSKSPGFTYDVDEVTVDFHYDETYKGVSMPDAYEKLIFDVFRGSQANFVRSDELREAWRIFDRILHKIEEQKIKPLQYTFGTTGPQQADQLEMRYRFKRKIIKWLNTA